VCCYFRERRDHRSDSRACGRWQRRPVELPEEEDSRAVDRGGPPVSEGESAGQAGPEGGGREAGRGWAANRKWPDSRNKILSKFIWNLDF
jgi:hypothetical protein